MRTSILPLLAFIVIAPVCLATPSLDPASGSPTHGQSFVLSGSNFGIKEPALPVFYSDFDLGVTGSIIGNGAAPIGTYHTEESDGQWATYSNERVRTNSSMSGRSNYIGNEWHSTIGAFVGSAEEVYTEVWMNYDECDPIDAFQIKSLRIWPTGTYPNFTVGFWCRGNGKQSGGWEWGSNCGSSPTIYGGTRPPDEQWGHIQTHIKHNSAPAVADGVFKVWRDGVPTISKTDVISRQDCGYESLMSEVNWGEYYSDRDETGAGCPPVGCDSYIYWDNMYIDTTPARVEIGNNSNYENCTHREIQIPTAWSSSSVTVTFNQGSFTDGSQVYMFVVDSNGNASNGVPVGIAGNGGGVDDTIPPVISISGHSVPNPTSAYDFANYIYAVIEGTSSDNIGVTEITWTNSRGGSGTAIGSSNWVINDATVYDGENIIQITCRDWAGNVNTESVTIVSDWPATPGAPAPPE